MTTDEHDGPTARSADDAEAALLAAHAAGAGLDPAVRAALQVAVAWVGDRVHLVGAGETDDGTPCVVVHASPGTELPDDVEGVPVRVVLDDAVTAHDDGSRPA